MIFLRHGFGPGGPLFLACVFIINGLLPKDKKEKHKNFTKNEQNGKIPLLKSCILHYN